MNTTDAIILGIIQGIFEWLPVSSEGMTTLYLIAKNHTLEEAIPISIWLHTGTLLAAALYFRKDIISILKNMPAYLRRRTHNTDIGKTTTFLIISTAATAIVGFPILLYSLNKLNFSGTQATALIGILLILTGLLQKKSQKKDITEKKITIADSIIVGVLQGFSAMPGLSRSGLTTSGLLLRRYDAKKALKLSFLMSIPAVFAAEIGLGLMGRINIDTNSLIAITTSFAVGYLTIGALIRFAQKIRFWKFCILLGILSLVPYILTL